MSSAGFRPAGDTFAHDARAALQGDADAALTLATDGMFPGFTDYVRFLRYHGTLTPAVFDLVADAWDAAQALTTLDSDCDQQGAA